MELGKELLASAAYRDVMKGDPLGLTVLGRLSA